MLQPRDLFVGLRRLSLLFIVCLLLVGTRAVLATEAGFTVGGHDMMVRDISPSSLHSGGTSNTFGINAGGFIEHVTPSSIVVGAVADVYLDIDRDHLDPDHIPVWFKINVYGYGPIVNFSDSFALRWLVDLRNKQNTTSGVEREIKNNYGLGLAWDKPSFNLGLKLYGGFFYLEIDDDAPREYAGYDREDLGNGTSSVSWRIDGGVQFTSSFRLDAHAQNWSSVGVGSGWLENEFGLELAYLTDGMIDDSSLHLSVLYTQYNLDVYYRPDLGKPVLPWDNDTLIRAYISIPWTF